MSGIIDHPAEKRAVSIAFVNALGNSASIYGSFLWPSTTGPRYIQGFATTTYVYISDPYNYALTPAPHSAFVFALAVLAQINKFLVHRYPGESLAASEAADARNTSEKVEEV